KRQATRAFSPKKKSSWQNESEWKRSVSLARRIAPRHAVKSTAFTPALPTSATICFDQVTTPLIRENETTCLERLSVKNLLKNPPRVLAISDMEWEELVSQLEYKAAWYGRTLMAIDRFFLSSKLCSGCGHQMRFLPLKIRQWTCPNCGL